MVSPLIKSNNIRTIATVTCGTLASATFLKFGLDAASNSHPEPRTANDSGVVDPAQREIVAQPKPGVAAPERISVNRFAGPEANTSGAGNLYAAIALGAAKPLVPQPKTLKVAPLKSVSSATNLQKPRQPTLLVPSISEPRVPKLSQAKQELPELARFVASADAPEIEQVGIQFKDTTGHWAQYFIETLAIEGIVRGYPDGRFRPDTPITPAQFALMTEKALGRSRSYTALQASVSNRAPTRAQAARFIHQLRAKTEPVPIVTDLRVQGGVLRPGRYSLAGLYDTAQTRLPTIFQAIQQAGGLQPDADLRRVQVHRSTEAGEKRVITLNLQTATLGKGDQDFLLQQGDEIFVPSERIGSANLNVNP